MSEAVQKTDTVQLEFSDEKLLSVRVYGRRTPQSPTGEFRSFDELGAGLATNVINELIFKAYIHGRTDVQKEILVALDVRA